MGRRGPQPEPTALRLIKGNPGKRAINKAEPKLEIAPASVPPPKHLKGISAAEWNRLYDELVEKGILTIGDLTRFEDYCLTLGKLREYERLAEQAGPDVAIIKGYHNATLKLRGQLRQLAADIGLTPASRSGIKSVEKEPKSKLSKFLGPKQA